MKKLLNILIISMLLLILIFPTKVLATDIDELIGKGQNFLSKGDPLENVINVDELQSTSKNIYNLLLTIGIAIAVIVGAILGIKIITAEVEEKAKLKEMIIPYILGCVIVFSAFSIWKTIVQIGSNIEHGEGYSDEQFTEGEKWVANLYNTYGNFIPLDGNGNIDEKTSTNNIKDFIEKYKNKYSSSSNYYRDGMESRRKNIFKAENRKWYNAGTTIEYDGMDEVLLMKNLMKYKRAALAEIEDSPYNEYVESLWDNFIKGVKKEPFDGPVYVN